MLKSSSGQSLKGSLDEEKVIDFLIYFISGQFPKSCKCCGSVFTSLKEYLKNTSHAGPPLSYDAILEDWEPKEPIGTVSMANCKCGTTLGISSRGIGIRNMWKLLGWARRETKGRQISVIELLEDLRCKIDKQVLHYDEAI